ncbi:MAG TPA: diacylglycerol kinase family protein [Vicinamibacteria bacterium]|nr:diacylglycerol kinase family protein [Vicinamibacteria bacterium]
MRILLLANAGSGSASRRRRAADFAPRLKTEGIRVDFESPISAEAMRDRAAIARRREHDVLLVSGGDGTLHAIVNGLVRVPKEERPALAVVPTGRGNDFAFELGIRSERDTLSALASGKRRFVDLGRSANGVFLGVAGAGFDAKAARRAQTTPFLSGSLLYSYAVVRTVLDFRPLSARVRYDGGEYEGPITFAAAGNTSRYGGGMRIAPEAALDDGLLDLCLVRAISRGTLLRMFPTVFSGRHLSHPSVTYVRTSFVEIETEERADVFADGELLQETPVRLEVLPRELEVVA